MLTGPPLRSRQTLLAQLARHQPFDDHEARMLHRIASFVEAHDDCFERTLAIGHVTGSAWIVDCARANVLLTHHAKLNKWLQPGGHADGDPDTLRVALREAREETGLQSLRAMSEEIFDLDAHEIPARGLESAHVHYDIRFLLEADCREPLILSTESHELAWVPLHQVDQLNTDQSVLRMVARTSSSASPRP
jgi:8-oxo-dGTP pyrophosphatase MutT (NUDIX family)